MEQKKEEEKTMEKQLSKKESNIKDDSKSIFNFFSSYFWGASIVLLLTLLIQAYFNPKNFFFVAILLFASTISISMIVATFFTYTIGTKEFIQFIQKKLEDIVISRKFLSNIDVERKEEALHALLKPSDIQEKNLYSNLQEYYQHFISEVMTVSKKNVRTMYRLDVEADYKKDGILFAKGTVVYRIFPSEKGYIPIQIGVNDNDKSGCKKLIINPPSEKPITVDIKKLEFKDHHDGAKIASIDLKKYDIKYSHLDIEIEFLEFGHDHWLAFQFVNMQPTDGFNFKLSCKKDITIKEKMIFDMDNDYNVVSDDNKSITLSNYQWMQERSGLVVIVSKPENTK